MCRVKIAMLGPTGVGKTSLLASMYQQFSSIKNTNLVLTPDAESSAKLESSLSALKKLSDPFRPGNSLKPTREIRSLLFGLGRKGKSPALKLEFIDYPGEYHSQTATPDERQFIRDLIQDCVAVLVPIDAPALMERNGLWHEQFNRTRQVIDIFKVAYQDLDSPRLVILAPLRCEGYIQENKSAKLLEKVQESYEELLDYFQSESLVDKVSVVVTPVQTVGNVIFSRVEESMPEEGPIFKFRRKSRDAEYAPQDTDQPLRYLLRFLLRIHLNKQRSFAFFNFIRDLFKLDDYLLDAIKTLTKGCKADRGFAVLQGEPLLRAWG